MGNALPWAGTRPGTRHTVQNLGFHTGHWFNWKLFFLLFLNSYQVTSRLDQFPPSAQPKYLKGTLKQGRKPHLEKAPAPLRKTENTHGPGQLSYLYTNSLWFLRSPVHRYFTHISILLKSPKFFIRSSRLQERKPLCAYKTANKQLQRMQCVVETDFRLPVTWHSLARRRERTFGYEFSINSPFAKKLFKF